MFEAAEYKHLPTLAYYTKSATTVSWATVVQDVNFFYVSGNGKTNIFMYFRLLYLYCPH